MRIVCIGHSLIHPRQFWLFERMASESNPILCLSPKHWLHDEFVFKTGNPHCRRIGLKTLMEGNHNYYTLPTAIYHAARFKPDIIYAKSEPWCWQTLQSYLIARAVKARFVTITCENVYKIFPSPFDAIEKKVIADADLIIAISRDAEKIMLMKGAKRDRLLRIPETGVNLDFFRPGLEPKYRRWKEPTLLYTGRLMEAKGLGYILGAIKMVLKEMDVHLIICGRGGYRKNIEFFLEKNEEIKNHVHLQDWVSWNDVPYLLNSADIFLYPSFAKLQWKEQLGWANLEALACGVPVISTTSGSIPEFIGDCPSAILIPEKNSEALFRSILKLLRDEKKLETMGEIGRRYVEENYSLEVIAQRFMDAFERVLE